MRDKVCVREDSVDFFTFGGGDMGRFKSVDNLYDKLRQ